MSVGTGAIQSTNVPTENFVISPDEFNQMTATGLPDRFGEAALRSFDYRTNEGVGTLKVEVYFLNR